MITLSRIIIISWLLLLSACQGVPQHPPMDLSTPKTTRSGLKIYDNPCDISHLMWWEKMHDPMLNQLIKAALTNNNQLETAEANILQAQAKLKQARFAWLPTLDLSGNGFVGGGWDSSFTPEGALAQSQLLSKMGTIHFRGYYSGFVPHYSLNILANIHNNKFAKASLDLQKATYLSSRLSIISQITGSYFMLLGQKEQHREQLQLVRDLKQVRQLEYVRYKAGASDLSTITSLDQNIVNQETSLSSIEDSIAQVENAIQLLLNRNPGPIITHQSILALSVQRLIPSSLPSGVLKNRPDIIMAGENLKMSGANLGLAYANFFPAISLTGLLGSASVELSHLLSISTGFWIAQAMASMPILNGANYAQINASKAGYSAAYFSYAQTVRAAFADVDNSLTHQQKMNAIYANKLKALNAAKITLALCLSRYKAGAKDYREVANAKLTVDYAALELNQAKMQQLDSLVGVYQALGGGYKA